MNKRGSIMFAIGVVALALSTAQAVWAQDPPAEEDPVEYEVIVAGTFASPSTVEEVKKIFAEQGRKGMEYKGNVVTRLTGNRKAIPENTATALIFEKD
ncbi:hypothetical protein EON79_20770 [bacterium]|nr:MAG: hypothetical protein EON79_20770 [bacterium]